jgi:transposase
MNPENPSNSGQSPDVETERERHLVESISKAPTGEMTQKVAAKALNISLRHAQRLVKQYRKYGPKGLLPKKREEPAHNAIKPEVVKSVVEIIEEKFPDVPPLQVSEYLSDHYGITMSKETVRQIMMNNGLWEAQSQKVHHRRYRERRSCYGELLQMDTSKHPWFGPPDYTYLINTIDDAKGTIFCRLYTADSTVNNMSLLKLYIERKGRPLALYTDYGSVFSVNPPKRRANDDAGRAKADKAFFGSETEAMTQFERALDELGVEHIKAHSPQAKGRVERGFRTLQARLTVALRFHEIKTIEEANAFLEDYFIDEYNRKFAREATSPADVHRPCDGLNLDAIFSRQISRYVNNDYTFKLDGERYQIVVNRTDPSFAKKYVTVEFRLNGDMAVRYNNKYYHFFLIKE